MCGIQWQVALGRKCGDPAHIRANQRTLPPAFLPQLAYSYLQQLSILEWPARHDPILGSRYHRHTFLPASTLFSSAKSVLVEARLLKLQLPRLPEGPAAAGQEPEAGPQARLAALLDSFADSGCNQALLTAPDRRCLLSLLGLEEEEELMPTLARLPIHPAVGALAAGPAVESITGAHTAEVGLFLCRRSIALPRLSELEIQQRTPPPLAARIRSMAVHHLPLLLLLLFFLFEMVVVLVAAHWELQAQERRRQCQGSAGGPPAASLPLACCFALANPPHLHCCVPRPSSPLVIC